MPERVTFTRKSADRIANAVKRVENMPAAEPIRQRRRAGGYRMESLWEVADVNTTDKVVTLKRVQDTDDNLNDRSETIDVAYDPSDEPTVGDRGLIIRLGDGTRFFFKKSATRVSYGYIDEHAMVQSDNPDTTFGYGSEVGVIHSYSNYWVTQIDHRFVWKWDTPLSSAAVTPPGMKPIYNQHRLSMGGGVPPNGSPVFQVVNYIEPDVVNVAINIDVIKEDFDCSTITWNVLNGLSKAPVYPIYNPLRLNLSKLGKDHSTDPAPWARFFPHSGLTWVAEINRWNASLNPSYGMVIYFTDDHAFQGTKEWEMDFSFTTGSLHEPVNRPFNMLSVDLV